MISSVNVTESVGNRGFGHIYWRHFFVQWHLLVFDKKSQVAAGKLKGLTPNF